MNYIFSIISCCILLLHCQAPASNQQAAINHPPSIKMRGLSFVAPPRPFTNNPMTAVQAVAADWLAIIPYAYTPKTKSAVFYNQSDWQWWGERPEGTRESIRLAKEANLKIMLKPQVYIPGGWTGGLYFETEAQWQEWEKSYEAYILLFAEMADSMDVELFCIGTEFKRMVDEREDFWRALIQKTRSIYKGKLTYAANWDEYEKVPFWDALDIAGINAYFPLLNQKEPSVKKLVKAWQPHKRAIQNFQKRIQKPIAFTEYGYLSVDGCAYNTWELEPKVKSIPINEQAQANALAALYTSFWHEPYWVGGFLWKWFPNNEGHEGYYKRDYTPQGKIAQQTLKTWFEKAN